MKYGLFLVCLFMGTQAAPTLAFGRWWAPCEWPDEAFVSSLEGQTGRVCTSEISVRRLPNNEVVTSCVLEDGERSQFTFKCDPNPVE